jgi:Flp pilus assembly pilin Flp
METMINKKSLAKYKISSVAASYIVLVGIIGIFVVMMAYAWRSF